MSVLSEMFQSRIERETFGVSFSQVYTFGVYYLRVISCINLIPEGDSQKISANCPESHVNSFFLSEGHCFRCVACPQYL